MGDMGMGGALSSPDKEDVDERVDGRVKNRAETSEEIGEDDGVMAVRCRLGV